MSNNAEILNLIEEYQSEEECDVILAKIDNKTGLPTRHIETLHSLDAFKRWLENKTASNDHEVSNG